MGRAGRAAGAGLVARLVQVQTPRPGRHVYYRCPEFGGSQKLACATVEPVGGTGRLERVTRIETKGEGGYCLVPPSPRECHPSLKCYRRVEGSPELTAVPVISPAERAVLLDTRGASTRSSPGRRSPRRGTRHGAPSGLGQRAGESRPGDAFNREADWEGILEPHGWVRSGSSGAVTHWRRPGKDTGTSATTGHCSSSADGSDMLYVFSSNAEPFEEGKPYGKFAAYTLLQHRGQLDGGRARAAPTGIRGWRQIRRTNELVRSDSLTGRGCLPRRRIRSATRQRGGHR